jgi:hypothetical protein
VRAISAKLLFNIFVTQREYHYNAYAGSSVYGDCLHRLLKYNQNHLDHFPEISLGDLCKGCEFSEL